MSFKEKHINLSNYEQYFMLYMDNELTAAQKTQVEDFIAAHPHLAEELDILMSTKLPLEDITIFNKEDLFSPAMQMNVVDESLLRYIDNELTSAERTAVEEKINSNKEYALQHGVLMQTKLDASETIQHPNKKELYRHTEKVVYFKVWMRVAAAIIIILLGSLFFLINSNKNVRSDPFATNPSSTQPIKTNGLSKEKNISLPQQQEKPVLVKAPEVKKNTPVLKDIPAQDKIEDVRNDVAVQDNVDQSPTKREIIKFDVVRFIVKPDIDPINKTITHRAVTTFSPDRITIENALEPADPDADFKPTKKTSAKGFFRKVTRFIERNTGIGTVNADNELLIGAVALKLK
jgi:hypothetical protein